MVVVTFWRFDTAKWTLVWAFSEPIPRITFLLIGDCHCAVLSFASYVWTGPSRQNVWNKLAEVLNGVDGICYYKHPIITSSTKEPPDLTLLANGYQPLAIKCFDYQLDEIENLGEETWNIRERQIDSPILELEDYVIGLQHKFQKERPLRHIFQAAGVIAFPLITKVDFERRFPSLREETKVMWADLDTTEVLIRTPELSDRECPKSCRCSHYYLSRHLVLT